MKGLEATEERIAFPAIYDEIYQWDDCDVVYTRKGDEYHYYDLKGNEILTEVRALEDVSEDISLMPYYLSEEQATNCLVTMQLTNQTTGAHICRCYGHSVYLDRIHRNEVKRIVLEHCEVKPLAADDLDEFYSPFTYIYSAYWATSHSSNPIQDCLKQLVKMKCFSSSWLYLIRIWTNPNTILPEDEWKYMDYLKEDVGGHVALGCGYDETLEDGEVRIFMVEYFTDRWPAEVEFLLNDALVYGKSVKEVKAALREEKSWLKKLVRDKHCPPDVCQAIHKEYTVRCMYQGMMSASKTENLKALELLKSRGFRTKPLIFSMCERSGFIKGLDYVFETIKWGIDNGSDINMVKYGQSCLDKLLDAKKNEWFLQDWTEEERKARNTMLCEIIDYMIAHGAKTRKELRGSDWSIRQLMNEEEGDF